GDQLLHLGGRPVLRQFTKQPFPYATARPTNEAVVEARVWPVHLRAVGPAATTFQHMNDSADDPAVVHALDASYVFRQMRLDTLPLLIVQPKEVCVHRPPPSPRTGVSSAAPPCCPAPHTALPPKQPADPLVASRMRFVPSTLASASFGNNTLGRAREITCASALGLSAFTHFHRAGRAAGPPRASRASAPSRTSAALARGSASRRAPASLRAPWGRRSGQGPRRPRVHPPPRRAATRRARSPDRRRRRNPDPASTAAGLHPYRPQTAGQAWPAAPPERPAAQSAAPAAPPPPAAAAPAWGAPAAGALRRARRRARSACQAA